MGIALIGMETIHSGWAKFSRAVFRLDNGETLKREVEDHGRAVAVLPYDATRKMAILIRQFRAPVFVTTGEYDLLEAVAGLVEEPDPEDAGRREVEEEAGLILGAMERVTEAWTMPGISTERMSLYLAPYDRHDRISAGGGVGHEQEYVEVVELPLAELAAAADVGRLNDMKTLLLLQTLRLRRPDLF